MKSNHFNPQQSEIRFVLRLSFILFMAIAVLMHATVISGMPINLSFEEVAQTADLIFLGTVESQECRLNDANSMILTDVYFKDIEVIYASPRSIQKALPVIRITYAGGQVGSRVVTVSDTPLFVDGNRYLLFILDDGKTYSSPIVGCHQGLFEVVKDSAGPQEYLIAMNRKAILKADANGVTKSQQKLTRVQNGQAIFETVQPNTKVGYFPQTPAPATSDCFSSAGLEVTEQQPQVHPLALPEFTDYVVKIALKAQLTKRKLRFGNGGGKFYQSKGTKVETMNIKSSRPSSRLKTEEITTAGGKERIVLPYDESSTIFPLENNVFKSVMIQLPGGQLGACGYHTLNLVMEQVPTSWWSWQINNDSMWTWNQFMDIYRTTPDDGSYGGPLQLNFQNEFCGWVNDADLQSVYGLTWNGGLAMCITWMGLLQPTCGEISQSDVLWNPAYSWTSDAESAIGNSNVILLRPVCNHELGHTWGYQRGTYVETYDYDQPSVMHAYYSDLVEDGQGIHSSCAYLIRRQYDDQTSIIPRTDVGVESYYASNGLNNSWTNSASYNSGDSITLNNVTVENMSNSSVSDLRIRFYLSSNRIISTGNVQIGSYWYWTSFSAESYNVSGYTTTIPPDTPSGSYYVGAIVTINGFNSDDLTFNNTCSFFDQITVTCPVPSTPTGISATDGTYCDRIRVSWNTVSGATSYEVWRDGGYLADDGSPPYDDYSAVAGVTYSYAVKAKNACGASGLSSSNSGYRATVPSTPTGISATDGTYCGWIRVSWDTVSGATTYEVYRNTINNSGSATYLGDDSDSPYDDHSVTSEGIYYYWVKAKNNCGTSGFSAPDSGYPDVQPTITQHPQNTTVHVGQDANFSVEADGTPPLHYQWKKNAGNVGTDDSTLTLSNVQLSDNGAQITCDVSNTCGTVTSNAAILTVLPVQYTITASAGVNGTVEPNGVIDVNAGDDLVFTATADAGFMVDQWRVDANLVQIGGNTYTLSDIQSNHTVQVTFRTIVGTLYVDANSPNDPGSGTENDAFRKIQYGIDAAIDGINVIVSPGVYTGQGNRDLDFLGKAITVRSENGPNNCIIDCNGTGAEPHRGFYFHSGEDANSIVDGFTVTNGYAPDEWIEPEHNIWVGGAIFCIGSSPTINNCAFIDNLAWDSGGGIGNYGQSNPTITNCMFISNSATNFGGGIYGGGPQTIISRCIITNNSSYYGGGICECDGLIVDCNISGNGAYEWGGGLYNCEGDITNCYINYNGTGTGGGGGLFGCNGTISNCQIIGNHASSIPDEADGGGLRECNGTIRNCLVSGNSAGWWGGGMFYCTGSIINCVISNNISGGAGGGLHACSADIINCVIANNTNVGFFEKFGGGISHCSKKISNCTIVGNAVYGYESYGGGLYDCTGGIENCIICGNTAEVDGNQIYASSEPNYSCIQDWTGGRIGNINTDPCFVNPDNNDFHLLPDSPCIDAGDPNYPRDANERDIDGDRRVIGCRIDMGVDEYQDGERSDLDDDGTVNFRDYSILASYWLAYMCSEPDWCEGCDYDRSGEVNVEDVKSFVKDWLWCEEEDINLIGYWKFDDGLGQVAQDWSGYGNNGTLIDEPVWTTGKFNGGLDFDGTYDAVEISTAYMKPQQGTISLLAYPEGFSPPENPHYLFGHTRTTDPWSDRIQLYVDDPNGNLDLGLGGSHITDTNIAVLELQKWHHVALTWDTGTYSVYVNGSVKASGSYTGLNSLAAFADIGNDGSTEYGNESFDGVIDDVRLYNRALSECEIAEIYFDE